MIHQTSCGKSKRRLLYQTCGGTSSAVSSLSISSTRSFNGSASNHPSILCVSVMSISDFSLISVGSDCLRATMRFLRPSTIGRSVSVGWSLAVPGGLWGGGDISNLTLCLHNGNLNTCVATPRPVKLDLGSFQSLGRFDLLPPARRNVDEDARPRLTKIICQLGYVLHLYK